MKPERSKIKSDILLRVRLLYVLFILAGGVVLVRLVWVQLFQRGGGLQRRPPFEPHLHRGGDSRPAAASSRGEPLATSIFRYQAAFDFASPGLDSLRTFREQADSLSKLLAAFFGDRPASEYARMFREEHARRYRLVNPRDTQYLRSEGWLSRMLDRLRGEEYVTRADLRHDPRPYARRCLSPRGGLRRVGGAAALSAAELEYGHGLPPGRTRRTHLSAGRAWRGGPSV